jgi:hypothetical protein
MGNYRYRTGSHRGRNNTAPEPELQWLEDSINLIMSIMLNSVIALIRFGFVFLGHVFAAIAKSRK